MKLLHTPQQSKALQRNITVNCHPLQREWLTTVLTAHGYKRFADVVPSGNAVMIYGDSFWLTSRDYSTPITYDEFVEQYTVVDLATNTAIPKGKYTIYSDSAFNYLPKDILYTDQAQVLHTVGTIVNPKKQFIYSGESFTTFDYGKIVAVKGEYVLVKWEVPRFRESYLRDNKHWIVPISKLQAVRHREVPKDFKTHHEDAYDLVNTTDNPAIVGKIYYLVNDTAVIATEADGFPICVEPSPSYKCKGCTSMSRLFERVPKSVEVAPTATIKE